MKSKLLHSIIFSLFIQVASLAQSPGYFIKNYLPKDYKGFNQMWGAVQDKSGLLFFASTSNVFIFSGKHWEAVPVKSGSAIRQIMIDTVTETIYLAVAGDFGYLERNRLGKFHFVSMTGQLTKSQKEFNDLWKILPLNGSIYFQSSERIFVVRDKKVADVIEAPTAHKFALSFIAHNRLYVRQRSSGLMEIRGNRLELVPGGELFADKRILSIMPFHGRSLVLSGDEGFFYMDPGAGPASQAQTSISLFKTDKFLEEAGVLGCQWVNDSVFAVNSRAGIAFYDKNGDQKEIINKASGLSDEGIADIFVDREKNVWLMHNNGVSCLGYNSAAFMYDDRSGFRGIAEYIKKYNGTLYLACGSGLFRLKQDPLSHGIAALPTAVTNTEVWDLYEHNDVLYVGTSNGLVRMNGDRAEAVTPDLTNRITSIPGADMLVTAEKGGFSVIDVKPGKIPVSVQFYEILGQELLKLGGVSKCKGEDDLYETWMVSRQKKTFHVKFGLQQKKLEIHQYDTLNGLPANENYIVYIGDSIFVCNTGSCYKYLPEKDISKNAVCFTKAPWTYRALAEGKCPGLKAPYDFRLFLAPPDPASITCFGYDNEGKLFSQKVKLGSLFSDNSLQCAVIEPDGLLWTVTSEFFASYDLRAGDKTPAGFRSVVQTVTIGKDSLIFMGSADQAIVNSNAIRYSDNSIAFSFDAPVFMLNNQVYFSCRLDGYDTTWSKPSLATEKNYTNLYEGTYTFRVRSVDAYGNTSSEGRYTFSIAPPWYRTYAAYFLYFLLFIVIIYLAIRITVMRLRRQKEKLEMIVMERTAEVVAQKQMLETAYVEIRDSIRYAKRIQNALLASDKLLRENLPEYFIYYKPKDIVSGDFYWAQPKGDWLYMITADCTGHGVPGAFMSLLNISFLNESINTTAFVSPAEILAEVRTRIIDVLRSDGSEEGGKDGMDCVLCAYNFKTRQLLFSAANNPLWICRDKTIIEYKADKYPVGKHIREDEPFRLQEVTLLVGDIVYTFTDGYADQFGGPAGKKFKVKQLKELLLSIAHLPMNEQKDVVSKTLRKWKKGIEQIDDVLVAGVRI
ncbi:MAG: Response regulator containing a CheY-like receiver domain and a domain protein [Bacteroidetes bacterium]|nr:Response regulator containing a CheY-like receiver domain and a domain protein [Bacteroidota bacterium]